jgi:hypothetical protein
VIIAAALAVLGCSAEEAPPPTAPARRATVTSEAGLYRVTLAPEDGRIPLGQIHAWVVSIATPSGEPVEPTRLAFDGGMPQHGHGFVTAPRVTRSLGGGRFRIEGVKFHMGGEWTLRVEVVGPAGPDVAQFLVQVDG